MSARGQEFISQLRHAGGGMPTPHTTGVTRINPEPGEPGYEAYAPPPEPDAVTQVLDLNGHPIRSGPDHQVYAAQTFPGDVRSSMSTWVTYAATPGHMILTVVDSGRVPRVSATITRKVAQQILPVLEALGDVLDLTSGGLDAETRPHREGADRPGSSRPAEPATERPVEPEDAAPRGSPPKGRPGRRGRRQPESAAG